MASSSSRPRADPEGSPSSTIPGDTSPAVPSLSPWRSWLIIFLLSSSQFLTQGCFALSLVPSHVIARTFPSAASSPGQISWFTAAYSLSVGTFILVFGQLGDIYGHKRLLVCGWTWLGVWSVVAGFAAFVPQTPVVFIVCRALQGIGPAMMLPNALAILGGQFNIGRQKEMAFAIFGSMAPLGFVVLALIEAAIAENAWWPWGFWGFGLFCGVLGGVTALMVPGNASHERDVKRIESTFDTTGALLVVSGLVLINIAWNQAPIDGWGTWYCPSSLVVGLICIVLFGIHERRCKNALLPMDIWNYQSAGIVICVALGWSSFGIWIYYTFQIIEILRHVSALMTAVQFIPETISGAIAALVTGYLLRRRWKAEWLMALAMTAFCVGSILSATAPVGQTYWANTFWTMVITSWGMDISFPASTFLISNMVPAKHQGIGASLITTVVNYSLSIGLGIAGTVESRVNVNNMKLLEGYRSALWTAVGLSGLGLLISLAFAGRVEMAKGSFRHLLQSRRTIPTPSDSNPSSSQGYGEKTSELV